ncbi:HTH-type transcriptional regulator RutR [compost metagenome]
MYSNIQGDKREAILEAAFSLFSSHGFYETTISDIADLAGIAKGTVYLYFSSKESLFTEVSRRDCDRFLNKLRAKLTLCNHIEEQLKAIASHHLHYYYERKEHTNLFFLAPNNDPELIQYMKQFMEDYMKVVVGVLQQEGSKDSIIYAQAYIGMLDRLKMDILFDSSMSIVDLEHREEVVASLFIHGFMDTSDRHKSKSR